MDLIAEIAAVDLDVAVQQLEQLLQYKEDERDIEWARSVCTYTRYVRINVWRDLPDEERVVKKIVPLVKLAYDQVGDLDSSQLAVDEKNSLDVYSTNIENRIDALNGYQEEDIESIIESYVTK